MAGASFTGDTAKLDRLAKRMAKLAGAGFLVQLNKQLAVEAKDLALMAFRTARDPYGKAWKKAGRGGLTLQDTRHLMTSIEAQPAGRSGFTVGSNVEYARIHNEGGVIRAKSGGYLKFRVGGKRGGKTQRKGGRLGRGERWVQVRQVTIPERRFLPKAGRTLGPRWRNALLRTAKDVRESFLGV